LSKYSEHWKRQRNKCTFTFAFQRFFGIAANSNERASLVQEVEQKAEVGPSVMEATEVEVVVLVGGGELSFETLTSRVGSAATVVRMNSN